MKKTSWLLAFLSLFMPLETVAQTQDIHTLGIVTQALEKAKRDNKVRQDTVIARKTHWIDNLDTEGKFESLEKLMVYRAYTKDVGGKKKYVEELVNIVPPRAEPASNPLDFDRLMDAFLSRFYFMLNPEVEIIDGQRYHKIHFWPRENLPPEKERIDNVLNRATGILYIEEKKYALKTISGHLREHIDKSPIYYAERFDFHIEFGNWNGLDLIKSIRATTKYQYRDPRKVSAWFTFFKAVKRFQAHTFWYEYGVE